MLLIKRGVGAGRETAQCSTAEQTKMRKTAEGRVALRASSTLHLELQCSTLSTAQCVGCPGQ